MLSPSQGGHMKGTIHLKDHPVSAGSHTASCHQGEENHHTTIGIASILLVDDETSCLQMLGICLAMEGFRVTCATNGYDALNFLKEFSYDFMLTDYNMPGMDGLRLSEEAKKIVPELTIIMLTGATLDELKTDAIESGISAVLAKPVSTSELLYIIKKYKL